MDSSKLECRKPKITRDYSEEDYKEYKNDLFQRMDTKLFHPYTHEKPKSSNNEEDPKIINTSNKSIKFSEKTPKPFNPYTKSYSKNETVWSRGLQNYVSEPYIDTSKDIRLRNKSKEGKKEFIIGFKKDIWDSLISKTTSNRTFNSNNSLKSLPDMKIYKKSLEHMIRKNIFK